LLTARWLQRFYITYDRYIQNENKCLSCEISAACTWENGNSRVIINEPENMTDLYVYGNIAYERCTKNIISRGGL